MSGIRKDEGERGSCVLVELCHGRSLVSSPPITYLRCQLKYISLGAVGFMITPGVLICSYWRLFLVSPLICLLLSAACKKARACDVATGATAAIGQWSRYVCMLYHNSHHFGAKEKAIRSPFVSKRCPNISWDRCYYLNISFRPALSSRLSPR